MIELKEKAERIIHELQRENESHIEVCTGTDASVELDIRDLSFVSVQEIYDSFVATRIQKKGHEYFVSLPLDHSMSDLRRSFLVADLRTRFKPFAANQDIMYQKETNPPDMQRLLKSYMDKLNMVNNDKKPYVNDLKIHTRTLCVKNTCGIDTQVNENYVVIRYDILDNGLDLDGRLCYEINYCRPGEFPPNVTDVKHSGKLRSMKSVCDSLVLLQFNVMLELLVVWAQEQNYDKTLNDDCFSDIINMSERAPFCRFPSIDDTGRNVKTNWLVRKGRVCRNRFYPQGEYRKEWQEAPKVMWNTLMMHPSKQPLTGLLNSIDKGFYISQILGLVLRQDFQKNKTLNLRFGGFDVCDGKIVGEFRWIERALSFPTLFRSVIAVDCQTHTGRWKWADGWYACPSVLVKDLF